MFLIDYDKVDDPWWLDAVLTEPARLTLPGHAVTLVLPRWKDHARYLCLRGLDYQHTTYQACT